MRGIVFLITVFSMSTLCPANTQDPEGGSGPNLNAFGTLPVYFIENQGQTDSEVAYYVLGKDKTLFFTSKGITFALAKKGADEYRRYIVKHDFVDANPSIVPRGEDRQKALFSYFKGAPEDWKGSIATYSRIRYENLWPGIDLVYTGSAGQLKYEFIVKPGTDPGCIRMAYRGASHVAVSESGALEANTPFGGFEDGAPYAYQTIEGRRKEVSMRYALDSDTAGNAFFYGFDLGDYDPERPLILDPHMLVYCGYIGGDQGDGITGMVVDEAGSAYVAGGTSSDELSFPVKAGFDLTFNGQQDGFIAKLNPQGSQLEFCTYLGGADKESCRTISLDGVGNIYVAGSTRSDETSFPVKVGPFLKHSSPGEHDVFVAKLNPQGTVLEFCGYIGGTGQELCRDMVVDSMGSMHVAGETDSDESSFPVVVGPDLTYNGWGDGFVAKVDPQGTHLDFCGYVGGDTQDGCYGIALDGYGCCYLSGWTFSDETSFPVKAGPDLSHNGNFDAFVAKLNPQGTDFMYCGYIGGGNTEEAMDIAVDGQGQAYVTGWTLSMETSFPVKVGPDLTFNYCYDVFVAKVDALGSDLVYCGYIGGENGEQGYGIAVDEMGCVYITGFTASRENTFPVKLGPDLTYNGDAGGLFGGDGFITKITSDGKEHVYCGYIGGEANDRVNTVFVDLSGDAYLAGSTSSSEATFPVANGPDLTLNGGQDAFVAKVSTLLMADTYELSESTGGVIQFTLDAGKNHADRKYLLLGSVTGIEPGTTLPGGKASLPLNWDAFTGMVISLLNTTVFQNFSGKLDGSGTAAATFDTLGPFTGGAGLHLYFAYALNAPWDFTSNAISIEIIP